MSGGFFNQIEDLVGLAILARERGSALFLPDVAQHVVRPEPTPFSTVFEVEPLARALSEHGMRLVTREDAERSANWSRHTIHPRKCRERWDRYQRQHENAYRRLPLDPLARAVHIGLVPHARLRSVADDFVRATFGGKPFGCLHARIERDMMIFARSVGGGKPPLLKEYLEQMRAVPELRDLRHWFVAVGKNIPRPQDERLLDRGTYGPWLLSRRRFRTTDAFDPLSVNPSFVRVVKVRLNRTHLVDVVTPGYLDEAVIDATVCRRASWFVGWQGSSFARGMARYHRLDYGRDYFSVCSNGSIARLDDGGAQSRRCVIG